MCIYLYYHQGLVLKDRVRNNPFLRAQGLRGKTISRQWCGGDALTLFASPLRKVQDRPGRDSHRLVEGRFSPARNNNTAQRKKAHTHTGNAKKKTPAHENERRERKAVCAGRGGSWGREQMMRDWVEDQLCPPSPVSRSSDLTQCAHVARSSLHL